MTSMIKIPAEEISVSTYGGDTGTNVIARKVGNVITVTGMWIYNNITMLSLSGLPRSSPIGDGFGLLLRDQSDGSIFTGWSNGSTAVILQSVAPASGHRLGFTYSYVAD